MQTTKFLHQINNFKYFVFIASARPLLQLRSTDLVIFFSDLDEGVLQCVARSSKCELESVAMASTVGRTPERMKKEKKKKR